MERLFFDVDGVLLNFEHAFAAWLNRMYGLNLPESYETPTWYFEDILPEDRTKEAWDLFLESPAAGQLKPCVEAGRFNTLTAGREVHLLTNFPEHHFEKRIENLALLGFRYSSLHHCGFHAFQKRGVASKSQVIASLLGGHEQAFFVDDHPDNCVDVVRNCERVEVWLMSRRFNRDFTHPAVRRARDWSCVIERLERMPARAGSGTVSLAPAK
jgi:FMN phosphatase YigB (HAD superfamily)